MKLFQEASNFRACGSIRDFYQLSRVNWKRDMEALEGTT